MAGDEAGLSRHRGGKVTIGLVVVIIALAGACVYLFMANRKSAEKQAATPAGQAERLTDELGGTIVLPNEPPALATVLDHAKLGNAQLVSEARNGDELLIYAKSRRLILYRPSVRKAIDMFHVEAAQANSAHGAQPAK